MMRVLKHLLPLLLLASAAMAEDIPPSPIVHAELSLDAPQVTAHEALWAAVTFTMPKGWHIYWQNPGDSGVATSLEWSLPAGLKAGDILWPAPERIDTGGIINYGYNDKATLLVPLTPERKNLKGNLSVKATWLACHDICIPESATLTAKLPQSDLKAAEAVGGARALLPQPLPGSASFAVKDKVLTLTVTTDQELDASSYFMPLESGVINDSAAQKVKWHDHRLTIAMTRGEEELPKLWHGILRAGATGWQITATQGIPPKMIAEESSPILPVILSLALLGGLLLNLMPCVLPILSLKALALVKKAGATPHAARMQGIGYTAGIVSGFLIIALFMLALKSSGSAFGWGFQLQQPAVVAGLIVLMFLVGLNLLGFFELPMIFASLAARSDEATVIGSFLTGLLAVAVATPCTAPFMAAAIGATLTLPAALSLLVFATLGLGMALPFLVISLWPAARRLLPKPGPWMPRLRRILALPVLATALWLLTVLVHLNTVKGAAYALAGCFLIFLLVLFNQSRANRHGKLIAALVVLVALVTLAIQPHAMAPEQPAAQGMLTPELFDPTALESLRAKGTPVFVDATAAWCITCKLNERIALHDKKVQQYFLDQHVVLMVADWTNGNAGITQYLASFDRAGVPLYVFYPPHGTPRVLPQLLTPSLVLDKLSAQ